MPLFQKRKIQLVQGKLSQVRLLGKTICSYGHLNGKKFTILPFGHVYPALQPIFYLKVNKVDYRIYHLIQNWVDIIHFMNGQFVFVCDKPSVEKYIMEKVHFYTPHIPFIASKSRHASSLVKRMQISTLWANAGLAHIATFLHAASHGIKDYWNIDVDDTFLCIDVPTTANLLGQVSQYAHQYDINLFSLDMHHSFSNAKHWSYGITYTRNVDKILHLFHTFSVKEWQKQQSHYHRWEPHLNIDWFTTWLGDSKQLNCKSWYVNDCYFLHLNKPLYSGNCGLSLFTNNNIHYPIFSQLYKDNSLGVSWVPIAKDDIKFDLSINQQDSFAYFAEFIACLSEKKAVSKVIFPESFANT